jgi:hypothetical protein
MFFVRCIIAYCDKSSGFVWPMCIFFYLTMLLNTALQHASHVIKSDYECGDNAGLNWSQLSAQTFLKLC